LLLRPAQCTLISAATSQELLLKTVSVSIQCLAYLRGIFHEDLFQDDSFDAALMSSFGPRATSSKDQRIMRIKRRHLHEADQLLDYIVRHHWL
jgi:hypothetical protein